MNLFDIHLSPKIEDRSESGPEFELVVTSVSVTYFGNGQKE